MFYTIVLIAHVFISLGLVALVLLQHGKGADAGAAFGSGASATVFGSQGSSNFLSHGTAVLATLFFFTSLGLAYMSRDLISSPDSVLERAAQTEETTSNMPSVMPVPEDAADNSNKAAMPEPAPEPQEPAQKTTEPEKTVPSTSETASK